MAFVIFGLACLGTASADTWWHLATGRWILEHHAVPHTDPFSFTAAGHPWVAHEYVSEIGMYGLYQLGGFTALTLANAALLTAAFVLTWLRCRSLAWSAAAATLLAAVAARPSFAIRPGSVSLFLAALTLWLATEYLAGRLRARWLFVFPLLALAWVQFHAGFLLGIALLVAVAAAEALDIAVGRATGALRRCAILLPVAACMVVVTGLNPNGYGMLRFPLQVMSMKVNAYILEWRPPVLSVPRFYPYIALMALTLLAMLFSKRKYRPGEFLLCIVAILASLRSGRNIGIATLLLAPLLAAHFRTDWLERQMERLAPRWREALAVAVLACAVVMGVGYARNGVAFQRTAERAQFPAAAADYIEAHNLPPNLLNDYSYGGYLIWRFYPHYKVYIDGRADMYGDEFLLNYLDLYNGLKPPIPLFAHDNVNTVILEPHSELIGLLEMMCGNHDWQRVYADPKAVIYVRTSALEARR